MIITPDAKLIHDNDVRFTGRRAAMLFRALAWPSRVHPLNGRSDH